MHANPANMRGDLLHVNAVTYIDTEAASRIIEVDPATLGIVWEYPGDSGEQLYTSVYGSEQVLPNGNILITESNNGRLLEVTRDREIVWEHFVHERRMSASGKVIAQALWAARFAADELEFEFNTSLR